MRTYVFHGPRRLVAIALAGLLTTAFAASAAEDPESRAPPDAVLRRLKELEEQVDRLNRETREHEVQLDKQKSSPRGRTAST
jgi:hypothetical protein